MSEYEYRHKRKYRYNSKLVRDGTVDLVRKLKAEGKTFEEIGAKIGKTKQQAFQIYNKAIAIR